MHTEQAINVLNDQKKENEGNPPMVSGLRQAAKVDGSWAPWNGGKTKKGEVVTALDVIIGEVVHNTDKVFVFLDMKGNVEWLWREDPPNPMWASARVMELESRCSFFSQGRDYQLFEPIAATKVTPNGNTTSGSSQPSLSLTERIARWFRSLSKTLVGDFDYQRHELSARRLIAQGIATLYEGHCDKAAELVFKSAENFILQRGREASLLWLYRIFGWLALLSAVALILIITKKPQTDLFWATMACVAAGGVGAYISRAFASRESLLCDANAGKRLHSEEAMLRWAVGSVAGGLVCLLIQGKVLLGTLPTDKGGFPVVLALALLAGMSERILPTLLNRFDDQLADTKPPTNPSQRPDPPPEG